MKKFLLMICLASLQDRGFCQQGGSGTFISGNKLAGKVYHFTRGLILNSVTRYGREAVYTDPLAFKLYAGSLQRPLEGDLFGTGPKGLPIKWAGVTADSLNRLRPTGSSGTSGGGGYLYLTYQSTKKQAALLNIKGNSSVIFNGSLHAGDPYSSGWLYLPVELKKGLNEMYVRGQNIVADLIFPHKPVYLSSEDATLPSIVAGERNDRLMGALVIINTSDKPLKGLRITSAIAGRRVTTDVPVVLPMFTRKIFFYFDATGILQKGKHDCTITLFDQKKVLDKTQIIMEATDSTDKYSNTFVSNIDGSLQYYAVTPQLPSSTAGSALFLSVHGAGVEAISQARAYQSKDWGTLVAATNRRPRGFNWEDWGRLDALEVLAIAKEKFKPAAQQIYLTGHSMGGHGTWFLGATYPDKWAAIGACAGYPTLKGYGSADGLIPDSSTSVMGRLLLRSGNQSDVLKLASNYKSLGIYIFHGDSDKVVPVTYARQMKNLLAGFHTDLSYYEYPGAGHWFGDQSVDWKPLFDFFKWHSRRADTSMDEIDFITANPGISADYRWASILQQQHPLQFSNFHIKRNRLQNSISGKTENILLLKLKLTYFKANEWITITLDSTEPVICKVTGVNDSLYLAKENGKWRLTSMPGIDEKGPHRNGTFKDAFNNRMLFLYGTTGNEAENKWSLQKAKYDAETWYYRGNGAVDIVADKEFLLSRYGDRGIILYGNRQTNSAWQMLLSDCPIQVERNVITAGNKQWKGDDLSAFFIWPVRNSGKASVGVISGSGIKGMNAANANQYFAGASGFPDFMIYTLDMLDAGTEKVKMAGFFDNQWTLSGTDFRQAD